MATVTSRVDDLDGKKIADSVEPTVLRLNERIVTLDLTEANQKVLAEVLAKYLDAGTPATPGKSTGSASSLLTGNAALASVEDIRNWAKANGHTVSERGRIRNEVLKAFNEYVAENPDAVDVDG